MQKLAEALQVKDTTVFELVHHPFYERDFVFFGKLTEHLGQVLSCAERDAMAFGELSELLYLSSLLHFSLTEETNTTDALRAEKQMPVLLGDLLYGRFISALIELNKMAYLPIYIDYLKQFNVGGVDGLDGRTVYAMDDAVRLLTEKTAEAMAAFCDSDAESAVHAATEFLTIHWGILQGGQVRTLTAVETLMQAVFGQKNVDREAMVC